MHGFRTSARLFYRKAGFVLSFLRGFELMKKYLLIASVIFLISACTSLTYHEENTLRGLKSHGITVDRPAGDWERPANPATAGLLNILPGVGNFYLASGNAGDSTHYMYGFLNLLF